MGSDNVVISDHILISGLSPDESNIFDLSKMIEREIEKIESRFMIKLDQKIIDHMKKEWGDSKFNTSLYALQKMYNELSTKVDCMSSSLRRVENQLDRNEDDE